MATRIPLRCHYFAVSTTTRNPKLELVSDASGETQTGRAADRLAERVTHEQAAQNKRLADATKSLTQESQQLVTAEARQEVIALQRDLRQDQVDIGRQRDSLEASPCGGRAVA